MAARAAAAGLLACGCNLIGPTCVAQQERGVVTAMTGTVAPDQIISVVVPYDARGSQNNVDVSWGGRLTLGGPRPQFFTTSADCQDFVPPPIDQRHVARGACTVIGGFGGAIAPEARECARNSTCAPIPGEVLLSSIIITGPGNGAPPGFSEYKLHIVGDPQQPADYAVNVTYFSGPDC